MITGALALLDEVGLDELTMRRLAQALGVRAGAIYWHFANRQDLEDALGENEPALLGLRLQDLKDQLLLAHAGGAAHAQVLRHLRELLNAHVLQIGDIQPGAALIGRGGSWS